VQNIEEDTLRYLFRVTVKREEDGGPKEKKEVQGRTRAVRPADGGARQDGGKSVPFRKDRKIGRNDPCPCGSGKKYKNCCGKLA